MKKVLIIGAGDLGQQIAHFVITDNQFEVVGYADDWQQKGDLFLNIPVLGTIDEIESLYKNKVFDEILIGVGYKHFEFRKELYERFKGKVPFATFIHSSCYVDPTAIIEEGVVVYPRCIIDRHSHIKANNFINWGTGIGHHAVLESHSFIAAMVLVAGFAYIGQMCMIGNGVVMVDHIHIEKLTTVGAGAVIVKNINTPNGIYVGNPAKYLKDNQ